MSTYQCQAVITFHTDANNYKYKYNYKYATYIKCDGHISMTSGNNFSYKYKQIYNKYKSAT